MRNPLMSSRLDRDHIARTPVINQTFAYAVERSVPLCASTAQRGLTGASGAGGPVLDGPFMSDAVRQWPANSLERASQQAQRAEAPRREVRILEDHGGPIRRGDGIGARRLPELSWCTHPDLLAEGRPVLCEESGC